jgi:hypothetical protein
MAEEGAAIAVFDVLDALGGGAADDKDRCVAVRAGSYPGHPGFIWTP